ncbi:MAG: PilZ domain-containing protein [Desulfobacterota bacterium]|nr:PilZ domain-containing protein [Thermodesulfobacteriota bacterium]
MENNVRAHQRFIPKKNAFAALGRGITLVGKISDISKGGLAFEHIWDIEDREEHYDVVDIFLPGNEFYLADIPCAKVYDIPIQKGSVFSPSLITKRCGIKFTFLTDAQIEQLEDFLRLHTIA